MQKRCSGHRAAYLLEHEVPPHNLPRQFSTDPATSRSGIWRDVAGCGRIWRDVAGYGGISKINLLVLS